MTIRRLAAAAVLASAAFAPAANAQSIISPFLQDLLNGCYGAVVTVCDPNVTSLPVELNRTSVPVCVNTCSTYSVPVPGFSGNQTCVAWSDHNGSQTERCTPVFTR